MEKLKAKLKKQGGFTLIEMLIVVAIIAILIAVSIPLVSGALEKTRDATDQANERAAKAEAILYYMGVASDPISGYTPGEDVTTDDNWYYNAAEGKIQTSGPITAYGQCTGGNTNDYCTEKHDDSKVIKVIITDGVVTTTWVSTPSTP